MSARFSIMMRVDTILRSGAGSGRLVHDYDYNAVRGKPDQLPVASAMRRSLEFLKSRCIRNEMGVTVVLRSARRTPSPSIVHVTNVSNSTVSARFRVKRDTLQQLCHLQSLFPLLFVETPYSRSVHLLHESSTARSYTISKADSRVRVRHSCEPHVHRTLSSSSSTTTFYEEPSSMTPSMTIMMA
ncbi:hypothetical protein EI94DRAFT_726944 [Lactarius quietus]|nr:hypothetical protein EI94DRAFT_726944 [Lactarius quietus]